mgnify:CR=1 FL=1
MMNRFPKVLLTLLLTLLLALSLSGCDLMVGTGPEAPIPPGVGQTGDQNTPDTPEEPGNTNTPEMPDAPQEPGTDDSSTGSKDRYQTDPVPDGKPKPWSRKRLSRIRPTRTPAPSPSPAPPSSTTWTSATSPSGGWCPPTG